MKRCAGCGDYLEGAEIVGRSHTRTGVQTYTDTGHGCDGSAADCERTCPVPVLAQRPVPIECGPVIEEPSEP